VGKVQGRTEPVSRGARKLGTESLVRYGTLALPLLFVVIFFVVPLALTVVVSFWERAGFWIRPALTTASYRTFFTGIRLFVLRRSLTVAALATALSLVLAYPIAYFLARHVREQLGRTVLLLFTVPFVINYIIRTFSWTYLLDRTGPINSALLWLGLVHHPLDWLLYSDFAVLLGLVASYMPFMLYPLWLAIAGVEHHLIEASWLLGAPPSATFFRVTLPLSMPGVFAAIIFGFVGSFGESAVPVILGGVGYQMMGNTITSTLGVLDYPLAAAMSSVVMAMMMAFLAFWYLAFDVRGFLGKIVRWRV
jgi:ABC-type spermidine/putrescine transport system permease subunit I